MSIQIHINGENAAEALRELTQLASGLVPISNPNQEAAKPPVKNSRTTKPVETPASTPDPEPEDKQVDEDTDNDAEKVEVPTVLELRAKAQEKGSDATGKKAVKALLDKFQYKSISDVPEEYRVAFLQELEAL